MTHTPRWTGQALALSSSHSPSPCADEPLQIHTNFGPHVVLQVHPPRGHCEVSGLQLVHGYFDNTPRLHFGNQRRRPRQHAGYAEELLIPPGHLCCCSVEFSLHPVLLHHGSGLSNVEIGIALQLLALRRGRLRRYDGPLPNVANAIDLRQHL